MSDTTTDAADPLSPYTTGARTPSGFWLRAGRFISVVPGLMILMGDVSDLIKPDFVIKGLAEAGYHEEIIVPLGVVTVVIALLYLVPQTMVLGGLFMLCYLGGAVAIHVRAAQYGQMFVPVAFGAVIWTGLLLREPRLRALLPFRKV